MLIHHLKKNCLAMMLLAAVSLVGTSPALAAKKVKKHSAATVQKSSAEGGASHKSGAAHRSRAGHKGAPVARFAPARHGRMARALPAIPLSESLAEGAAPVRKAAAVASTSAASGASFGQLYGLHHTPDPLDLQSSVAFVMDQDTNEVLLSKNSEAVLPIASLTKLMTAMVVVEGKLPMDEPITVTAEDVDTVKNSSSRLAVGATLTRGEMLHLALMASENRAAHALGRTYPGGMPAFVNLMNHKAQALGMSDTRYVEPTGLNSQNQSSGRDLATLVKAAYQQPLIRELSTSHEYAVHVGARQVQFRNTNGLVRNPTWDIGLQKTGYIVEAGRCLVMQARMAGRKLIMVFLDSTGKYSRQADAQRVRRWIEQVAPASGPTVEMSAAAKVTS